MLALCIWLITTAAVAQSATASDDIYEQSERLYLEGLSHFREGVWAEAMERFQKAAELDPAYYLAVYYAGVALAKMERYGEAVTYLERTVTYLDTFPEERLGFVPAHQDLAVVYYQLGRHQEAARTLADAAEKSPESALIRYYTGLVQYRLGDHAAARESIQAALRLDADLGAAAHYHLGLAYLADRKTSAGKRHLEIARESGEPEVARQARELEDFYDDLQSPGAPEKRWQVRFGLGVARDSNVILEPDESPSFSQISDEADTRVSLSAGGSFNLVETKRGYLQVEYDFQHSLHADIDAFDLQLHRPRLTAMTQINGFARIGAEAGFSAYRLGGDDYLRESYVRPFFGVTSGDRGYTSIFYRFSDDNFLFDAFDPIRDGQSHQVGVDHYFLLDGFQHFLWAGYDYHRDDPDSALGNDFDLEGHSVRGGARLSFNEEIILEAGYWFRRDDYDFPNSRDMLGRSRRDRLHTVQVKVMRPLNRYLTLEFHYLGRINHSNLEPFEYRRHVVGGGLSYVF